MAGLPLIKHMENERNLEAQTEHITNLALKHEDILAQKKAIVANILQQELEQVPPHEVEKALNNLIKKITRELLKNPKIEINTNKQGFKLDHANAIEKLLLDEISLEEEKSALRVAFIQSITADVYKPDDIRRTILVKKFDLFFTYFVSQVGQTINMMINNQDPKILQPSKSENLNFWNSLGIKNVELAFPEEETETPEFPKTQKKDLN